MPTIRVNGVNLYYELNGIQGEPILLIHDSWVDHQIWAPVLGGLSESHIVLAYDRRGHGSSETAATQGSYEEDASDASELLTKLGLAPVHVIGNSVGGVIALKLAAHRSSLFRSLIVHEPPLFNLLEDDPSLEAMLVDAKSRINQVARMLERGDKVGGACLYMEGLASIPGIWERIPSSLQETYILNADTFLDEARDPEGLDLDLSAFSQFNQPILFTYGGRGLPCSSFIIKKLMNAIPESKVMVYPNDGNMPHVSNPNIFVRRTLAFINSLEQLS